MNKIRTFVLRFQDKAYWKQGYKYACRGEFEFTAIRKKSWKYA